MKTIFTPRSELVCGKIDLLREKLQHLGVLKRNGNCVAELMYLVEYISEDCNAMERKLISRKKEVADLKKLLKNVTK